MEKNKKQTQKKVAPQSINPLEDIGLDALVKGITNPDAVQTQAQKNTQSQTQTVAEPDADDAEKTVCESYLKDYTGVKEQGVAVWLPTEVKKELDVIRANAKGNIPLRALAAAMVKTFISEHKTDIDKLAG